MSLAKYFLVNPFPLIVNHVFFPIAIEA